MDINLSLVFEESPDGETRNCFYCHEIISGKKYQAILQIEISMKAFDLFICEKCYGDQNGDQNLNKIQKI